MLTLNKTALFISSLYFRLGLICQTGLNLCCPSWHSLASYSRESLSLSGSVTGPCKWTFSLLDFLSDICKSEGYRSTIFFLVWTDFLPSVYFFLPFGLPFWVLSFLIKTVPPLQPLMRVPIKPRADWTVQAFFPSDLIDVLFMVFFSWVILVDSNKIDRRLYAEFIYQL